MIASAAAKVASARRVMSRRLPIGVATTCRPGAIGSASARRPKATKEGAVGGEFGGDKGGCGWECAMIRASRSLKQKLVRYIERRSACGKLAKPASSPPQAVCALVLMAQPIVRRLMLPEPPPMP